MTRSAIATATTTSWAAVLRRLARLGTLATLAAPLLMAGCKQEVLCPALDTCGGSLVGDWQLANDHPACSEDVYSPPADPRLGQALGDLPAARTPPPEPALYDWCDLLVTGFGSIVHTPPLFYTQGPSGYQGGPANVANDYVTGPIGAATIHYDANGTYTLSTTRTGTYFLDFPAFCMRAFGAKDGNPINPTVDPVTMMPKDPTPGNVCQQLQFGLQKTAGNNYKNIGCQLDPNDAPAAAGCICQFDLMATTTNAGFYGVQGGTVQHLPGNNFPQYATFCSQNDSLELTGADGAYLFDRVGLRTLDLVSFTPAPPTPAHHPERGHPSRAARSPLGASAGGYGVSSGGAKNSLMNASQPGFTTGEPL